jgi:glyoxylase-like metal-dependent hydrolase (beta-lactamase superfamily II)
MLTKSYERGNDRTVVSAGWTLNSEGHGNGLLERTKGKGMKRRTGPFIFGLLAGALFLAFCFADGAIAEQEPKRAVTRISGDLYRFQNNFHFSVFLVTPDGVIATDPINADAARWLEKEIARRFDKEVKYLIYSHDHADHISGGQVFADTAMVVAHENAKAAILGENRPTAVPDLTFSERMTIALGGKTVELIYLGRSHSNNMIVMRFPAERALFAVDFVSVKRLPYRTLSDAYFPDWIDAIKRLEALDFDILVPGHGPLGTKVDAGDHRRYLEDLYRAVLHEARTGRSLEERQRAITLEAYRDWGHYEAWRPLNIEGMLSRIRLHRRGN